MVASRRRWLVEGRAKTAAVLLLLVLLSSSSLAAFAGGAATAAAGGEGEEPDAGKLSTVGVDRSNTTTAAAAAGAAATAAAGGGVGAGAPKPHLLPSAVLPPGWYSAWATLLQAQLDGLFALVEQRNSLGMDNTLHTAGLGADDFQRGGLVDDGLGFKILLVGDSTVRAQANMMSWILSQRKDDDGRKQCFKSSVKAESGWADVFCTGADGGFDVAEGPPEGVHVFLTVHYVKTYDGCVSEEVDADFVYFGCGLHFLQLIPNRTEEGQRLDAWVHYERLLEEAVLFYRSGGGKAGNRVPVGEAFMTTHSFTVDRLEGAYMTRVGEYVDGKESVLARCRAVTNSLEPIHGDWPNEYEPEEICTRGIFDDNGVADLNRRAEGVMDRLGVPTVKAYDITKGQAWATLLRDGRHYAGLVPLEVNSMLSEITTALRRERRAATA